MGVLIGFEGGLIKGDKREGPVRGIRGMDQ